MDRLTQQSLTSSKVLLYVPTGCVTSHNSQVWCATDVGWPWRNVLQEKFPHWSYFYFPPRSRWIQKLNFKKMAFIFFLLFTSFVGSYNCCLAGVCAIPRISRHSNNIYLVKLVPSEYTSWVMWVIPVSDLVNQADAWILLLIYHQKPLD